MKLAAWHLMIISGLLLLAVGSLRAQMPESLPEPNSKSSVMTLPSAIPSGAPLFESSPDLPLPDSSSKQIVQGEPMNDVGLAPDPKPFPASSGYWWRDGCWYGDFDFVIWNRSRAHSKVLGAEETTSSGTAQLTGNFLNAKGQAFPLEAGGRGTLGYIIDRDVENRDHSIEFTYLGFNNWEQSDSLTAQAGNTLQVIPLNVTFPGFSNATTFNTTYRSDLQSMELDYRVRNRPGRDQMLMGPDGYWSRHLSQGRTESLFVGLRGISEEEQFDWASTQAGTPTSSFSGNYRVNTKNHLLGFQVGGDCYDVHENFYWGIKGDAGIYCNFTQGFANVVGIDTTATPTPPAGGSATNQTAAFLGELSFVAGYDINDHLMVHAGWDLVQLGGLASAPDTVSFDSDLLAATPRLRNDGQIFFNGLSVGLEAYW